MIIKVFFFIINQFFFIFVEIRNLLFDFKILPSFKPKIYTIVVGNISFGGTGKSPFVKFLVENLNKNFKIAVLSRGYGRNSKGLIVADINSDSFEIGDEAKDLFDDFGTKILILCSNSRVKGIKYIEENYKDVDLIIMDDGYQHRWVKPHFSIILEAFDYNLQIKKNKISEFKREPFYRINRADLFIQTKLPDYIKNKNAKFDFNVYQNYSFFNSQNIRLFFKPFLNNEAKPIVAKITALADNKRFYYDLSHYFQIKQVANFLDHHIYIRQDVEIVLNFDRIIISSKDWVKIKQLISEKEAKRFIIVKYKIDFKEKETEFLEILTSKIDNYYQNLAKKT